MGKRRIIWLVNEVLLLLLSRFSHVHSVRPHRQQPTRLPRPWDSPGKNTGVGCHFLLQCNEVLVIHNYHPKESTAWERNRPRTKLSEFKWQTLNKGRTSRKNSPTTVTNQNEVRPEEPRRKDASRGGKVSDSVGCRLGNVSGASSTEVTQWLPAAASVTWRNHETRGSRSDYKVKRLRHRIQMLKKKKKKNKTLRPKTQALTLGPTTRVERPRSLDCSALWWVRNFPACTNELICLRGVLQPPEEDEVTAIQPHPIPHRGITLAWNNLFCLWPPCLAFKNLSFSHSPDGMPPNSRLIQ